MEINIIISTIMNYTQFKIDLIVWKSNYELMNFLETIEFKIDLIVWKVFSV